MRGQTARYNARRVVVVHEDGRTKTFDRIYEAARYIGVSDPLVGRYARHPAHPEMYGIRVYFEEDFDAEECKRTWKDAVKAIKHVKHNRQCVAVGKQKARRFKSLSEAAREMGLRVSIINARCERNTYDGAQMWFFADEFDRLTI